MGGSFSLDCFVIVRCIDRHRIADRFELEHLSTGVRRDHFKLEPGRAILHEAPEKGIYRIG